MKKSFALLKIMTVTAVMFFTFSCEKNTNSPITPSNQSISKTTASSTFPFDVSSSKLRNSEKAITDFDPSGKLNLYLKEIISLNYDILEKKINLTSNYNAQVFEDKVKKGNIEEGLILSGIANNDKDAKLIANRLRKISSLLDDYSNEYSKNRKKTSEDRKQLEAIIQNYIEDRKPTFSLKNARKVCNEECFFSAGATLNNTLDLCSAGLAAGTAVAVLGSSTIFVGSGVIVITYIAYSYCNYNTYNQYEINLDACGCTGTINPRPN